MPRVKFTLKDEEHALPKLIEMGEPWQCLRDDVYVLTEKQMRALRSAKIPFRRLDGIASKNGRGRR